MFVIEFKNAENLHSGWDIWTFWISNAICLTMIVISTAATVYIFRVSD